MARNREKRKPMAEINVVPYIDVMLVLLVIFMITAPLLTQGVDVDLPEADANIIEKESNEPDPVIVSVSRDGDFFIDVGEGKEDPVDNESLMVRVQAVLKYKPKTPVMVRGDRNVDYGRVVQAMVLLQAAGVPSVGLITEPPEEPAR